MSAASAKIKEKFTPPTTPEELEEFLVDEVKMKEMGADPEMFKAIVHAYAKAALKTGDISAKIAEETKATLQEWLKEQGVKRPNLTVQMVPDAPIRNALYNPKAVGAKIDGIFDGTGDYLNAIWHRHLQTRPDPRVIELQAYSETIPDAGGFLVPETLRSEILRVSLETAIVRPRARVIPMDSLRVPLPAIDSTTNVGSVYGGIIVYWTPESGTIALNDARFGRVVLEAKKLTAGFVVPNELLQDSIVSFAAFVNSLVPEAMSFAEDIAFLTGSGVGEPQGVLNSPACVVVAKEAAQVAATIVWQNLVKMYARMLPGSLGRAVWVASIDTFPQLAQMALAVGAGGSAIWINNGALGPPMTILGRPVIFSEKVPRLGCQGQIAFLDLGYYLVGDRQTMTASSSEHIRFQTDETMYRIIERVDGRGWIQSAITPANASASTLSPFVVLAL